MYQSLTLEEIFGDGASQNGSNLIIQKTSLPLTPLSNNSASCLLAAILIKALENFQGQLDFSDEYGHPIDYDNRNIFELASVFFWDRYFVSRNNNLMIREEIIIESYEQD